MRHKAERAAHYRNKAEETLVIAESVNDPGAKEFLVNVAADYTMLADFMERSGLPDPIPGSSF